MVFSKNGNSDNNLALVNFLIFGFMFFHKMKIALIGLYYSLASSLFYCWQTKKFQKIIYLDG